MSLRVQNGYNLHHIGGFTGNEWIKLFTKLSEKTSCFWLQDRVYAKPSQTLSCSKLQPKYEYVNIKSNIRMYVSTASGRRFEGENSQNYYTTHHVVHSILRLTYNNCQPGSAKTGNELKSHRPGSVTFSLLSIEAHYHRNRMTTLNLSVLR